MTKQKGFVQILIIAAVVVTLSIVGYVLYARGRKIVSVSPFPSPYQVQYRESASAVAPIANSSDLTKASANLDASDTTQIDSQLNALNSASAGF